MLGDGWMDGWVRPSMTRSCYRPRLRRQEREAPCTAGSAARPLAPGPAPGADRGKSFGCGLQAHRNGVLGHLWVASEIRGRLP